MQDPQRSRHTRTNEGYKSLAHVGVYGSGSEVSNTRLAVVSCTRETKRGVDGQDFSAIRFLQITSARFGCHQHTDYREHGSDIGDSKFQVQVKGIAHLYWKARDCIKEHWDRNIT